MPKWFETAEKCDWRLSIKNVEVKQCIDIDEEASIFNVVKWLYLTN